MTSINQYTFSGCEGLKEINFHDDITGIGSGAFSGCLGVEYLNLPKNLTYIGEHAFAGCKALKTICLPDEVDWLSEYAFDGCSGLEYAIISNKVSNVRAIAFNECTNLSKVVLGSSVSLVGSRAFSQCAELKDVYCYAEKVPKAESDAFSGSYVEYAKLHVPASSINAYKEANVWKDFGTIVALTDDDPDLSGIPHVLNNEVYPSYYFLLDGKQLHQPQHGLNIIRMNDGSTRKIMIK